MSVIHNANIPSLPIFSRKINLRNHLVCGTTRKVIKYEWTIFVILSFLLISTIDDQMSNIKVVIYGILFLLLDTLKSTNKCMQIEDPLSLGPIRHFIKQITILLQINMIYLIFRILIDHHNVYSFLLFFHYCILGVLMIDKSKKNQIGLEVSSFWKILTPLLLFIFSIIINHPISQISLIQLILLSFNLYLTIQIKCLIIGKECLNFGWQKHQYDGKTHLIFKKKTALRIIIILLCFGIVIQNLMFMMPTICKYASITLIHSLILGIYSFLLFKKQRNI